MKAEDVFVKFQAKCVAAGIVDPDAIGGLYLACNMLMQIQADVLVQVMPHEWRERFKKAEGVTKFANILFSFALMAQIVSEAGGDLRFPVMIPLAWTQPDTALGRLIAVAMATHDDNFEFTKIVEVEVAKIKVPVEGEKPN